MKNNPAVQSLVPLYRYGIAVRLESGKWAERRVSCVDYDAAMRAAYVFQGVVPNAAHHVRPRVGVVHGADNLPVQDGWQR